MTIERDKVWLWSHPAGSHNGQYNLPADSSITPAGAAEFMGISKVALCVYKNQPPPPFEPHARELSGCDEIIWSIVGDAGSSRTDRTSDLDAVCQLARTCSNLSGALMDDFFLGKPGPDGEQARHSIEDVKRFRDTLRSQPRPLDLWAVMYDHLLGRPIEPFLQLCDVLTFWTWNADNLTELENNFTRFEKMAPNVRKFLGLYMWDFGHQPGREIPEHLMQHQLDLAEKWLAAGRIEGVVPLASCICDLDIKGVHTVREWLKQ